MWSYFRLFINGADLFIRISKLRLPSIETPIIFFTWRSWFFSIFGVFFLCGFKKNLPLPTLTPHLIHHPIPYLYPHHTNHSDGTSEIWAMTFYFKFAHESSQFSVKCPWLWKVHLFNYTLFTMRPHVVISFIKVLNFLKWGPYIFERLE